MDHPLAVLFAVTVAAWGLWQVFRRVFVEPPRRVTPPTPEEEERRQKAVDHLHERLDSIKRKQADALEEEIARDPAKAAETLRRIIQKDSR